MFGVLTAGAYTASILASLVATALVGPTGLETRSSPSASSPGGLAVLGVRPLLRADREAAVELAALAPRIALLEVLDLFASASRPVVEQLARAVDEVEVARTRSSCARATCRRAVRPRQRRGRGDRPRRGHRTRRLRTMGPRSLFGEIGVLRGIPRTATVRALEPCVLWRIDGEAFAAAVETAPVSASLLSLAGARLARTHPTLAAAGRRRPVLVAA